MSLVLTYDAGKKVLHVTATKQVEISTVDELNALCSEIRRSMTENAGCERSYMIVDMSAISIDPSLLHIYSEHLKTLFAECVIPGGLARYGMQITRVTAQLGHEAIEDGAPPLFRSKREAFEYIESKVRENARDREAKEQTE